MGSRTEQPTIGTDEVSHKNLLDAMDDAVIVYRGDTIRYANDAAHRLLGYEDGELGEIDSSSLVHPADRERLRDYQRHRYSPESNPPERFVARILGKDNTVHQCEFDVQVVTHDGGPATLAVVRDITDRDINRAAERRETRALKTLKEIYQELLGVTRALVRTPDRSAVEHTICARLAATDLYEFAWLYDIRRESRFETAGTDPETVTALYENTGPVGDELGPANRAVSDNEVRVADGLSPVGDRQGRVAAIPIGRDVVDNVLLLYTDRTNAFGIDERAALDVFGEIVGFVFTAIDNRELLNGESATELAFDVSDPEFLLVQIADTLTTEVELHGIAAHGSIEHWYCSRDGDLSIETVGDLEGVIDVTHIDDETGRFEVVVDTETVLGRVARSGAIVTGGSATPRKSEVTFCVTANVPPGRISETLGKAYPHAELIRKRQRDERVWAPEDFRALLDEELTERRRAMLEAAYHAGYFEWPRETTGEEIAESMGVTQPTFHNHLRHAEQTILRVLFDPSIADGDESDQT